MITKDNILQVRFANPENTVIEVLYNADDGKTRRYNIPARPTNSREWKILKAAGWTLNKVKTETVEWTRRQSRMFGNLVKDAAEQKLNELREMEWKRIHAENKVAFDKLSVEERQKYNSRIRDITSAVQTGDVDSNVGLYSVLKDADADGDTVFKFKLAALEDAANFEGLSATAEKKKRREIRKATTLYGVMEAMKKDGKS